MAKKRKSSKCPEPFNTLIDIAAGITMNAVANHMEKKYNYRKKGKINPYKVSAWGLGTGKMNSTEDILRTGAFLGAMGSFDVEADEPPSYRPYVPEDPVFSEIRQTKVNDNRYAWRLNCEDGSEYGIYPHNYETKAAYNEALRAAKNLHNIQKDSSSDINQSDDAPAKLTSTENKYIYCRVSRLDNGLNQYFISEGNNIKVGDTVTVPTDTGTTTGIVVEIKLCTSVEAPQPLEDTKHIIMD